MLDGKPFNHIVEMVLNDDKTAFEIDERQFRRMAFMLDGKVHAHYYAEQKVIDYVMDLQRKLEKAYKIIGERRVSELKAD